MALGAFFLSPRVANPVSFDGLYSYLPMARELMANGWSYLQRPESVAYAPLSFAYPALLGAHENAIRYLNIALYCVGAAFAYLALARTHGERTGVIAAFLVALCPTVRPYIADVMTEAPFIFLIAAWILCVARVSRGGGMAWVVAGGIAFGLAVLARPAAMYFAPLAFAWCAWKRQWRLAGLHAIAAAIVGLWVLHNAITFGFPTVSAGAGAALYFGVNPLVDGADPPYYGLQFDSGYAQDAPSHLSIRGDRNLLGIAKLELLDTPLSILIPMFAHKALAFLFVSSTDTSGIPIVLMRAWRVLAVLLAVVAVIARRREAVVAALAGFVLYMWMVHIPLLYTHRYSVGALDYPLALLAAVGLGEALRSAGRATATLVGASLALGVGLVHAERAPGTPMPERIPTEVVLQKNVAVDAVIAPPAPIDIDIPGPPGAPWDISMVQLDLAARPAKGGECPAIRVRFKRAREAAFVPYRVVRVPIEADEKMHRYTFGSTVPLALDGAGTLRVEMECTSAAIVRVGTIAVLMPRREMYYANLYRTRR